MNVYYPNAKPTKVNMNLSTGFNGLGKQVFFHTGIC